MPKLVVTNNPMVFAQYKADYTVLFMRSQSILDVFVKARDEIHKGRRLLTHPLSGSVKPGETPYKTLVLTGDAGAADFQSLLLIEAAVETTEKFLRQKPPRVLTDKTLSDFQMIDYDLIKDSIERATE